MGITALPALLAVIEPNATTSFATKFTILVGVLDLTMNCSVRDSYNHNPFVAQFRKVELREIIMLSIDQQTYMSQGGGEEHPQLLT